MSAHARLGTRSLTVEAAYALGDPARARVYYLELFKEYGGGAEDDCLSVSYGAGWFLREGNGPFRAIGIDVASARCDREGVRYHLPLGAIRIAGRLFWIGQWSGWDYEEYDIIEILPDKVDNVLHVRGGGC